MKIGVRAHDYGKQSIQSLTGKISEDYFETIQLAIPKAIEGITSYDDITDEIVQDIYQTCQKNKIQIAVLGCYIDLAHCDEVNREKEVSKFLKGLEIAKTLKAGCVGTETSHFTKDSGTREEAFSRMLKSVSKIIEKAEELQVDIGIEPVASHTLNTPELTQRLIQTIQSERLKIILDPVNLLTSENIKQQDKLWEKCFELFGDKICAMHFKGIKLNEGMLEKVPLLESEVHYKKILDWLKMNKPHISILREEADPTVGKEDYAFIKKFIEG